MINKLKEKTNFVKLADALKLAKILRGVDEDTYYKVFNFVEDLLTQTKMKPKNTKRNNLIKRAIKKAVKDFKELYIRLGTK